MYTDQTLTCRDCGQSFAFTASEQDFYAQRGFSNPLRCPSCRASRKAARGDSGGGWFINDGGIWKLAGISYAADGDYNTTSSGAGFRAAMFDKGGYYVPGDVPGSWVFVPDVAIDRPSSIFASRVSKSLAFITQTIGLSSWNLDNSSNWNNSAAWAGGYVPSGVDNVAEFYNATTASRTVSVTAPVTVGTIDFQHNLGYVVAGPGTISLAVSASPAATIRVRQGSHMISAPLALAAPLNLDIQQGSLALGGLLDNPGGRTLTKMGAGDAVVSGPQNHGPGAVWNVNGGSLTFASDGGQNLVVHANATTYFSVTQQLAGLTVGSGASVTVNPGNDKTLALGSLGIDALGKLDLRDNSLIVHATSLTKNATLAAVSAELARGFNAGHWNGFGLGSFFAANDDSHRTALGVLLNDRGDGQPLYNVFGGLAATANDILVAYTYYGDANLDGLVDGTDFALADNGFNFGLSGWRNGDFNYDGQINGADYSILDNGYHFQGGPLAAPAGGPIAAPPATAADPLPFVLAPVVPLAAWSGPLAPRQDDAHRDSHFAALSETLPDVAGAVAAAPDALEGALASIDTGPATPPARGDIEAALLELLADDLPPLAR